MPTTLITGSASGIGAATARLLKDRGHRVIGMDLHDANIEADLSTTSGRSHVIERVLDLSGGQLDGLVLCAGLGPHFEPATRIVSVNYFGSVVLLDQLLPCMNRNGKAAAVVVSSVVACSLVWAANPLAAALTASDELAAHSIVDAAGAEGGFLAYVGSKNGLTVATRLRATTWGEVGVRLNCVAPGPTSTPLLQAGLNDARFGEAIRGMHLPLGRRGDPTEIAATIEFLLSPAASYVHGAQLVVDGGSDAAARPTLF